MEKIYLFDLDDTLFHHHRPDGVKIHVLDESGNRVSSLSNEQYNNHILPENYSYDFSEFQSADLFCRTATPIPSMLDKLIELHNEDEKVEILTAREDFDDKSKFADFLSNHGIDIYKVHVRRAGNVQGLTGGNPAKKSVVVAELINNHKYTEIHLYDDSNKNLEAFLKLKDQYPEVHFFAHHVKLKPNSEEVHITTRKV